MRRLCLLASAVFCALPAAAAAQAAEYRNFSAELLKAAPRATGSDGTAAGRLGTRRMRRANRIAARILRQRLRSRDLRLIRSAGAASLIVVKGSYDRVQDVLRAVGIKHVLVPPRLLARIPLMSLQTLMINCPGNLSRAAKAKVRRFVKTGGFLVTTDWALSTLQSMIPGFVSRGRRNTRNDVVKVRVHDRKNPLLAHVKLGRDNPRWWLEASSFPIRILDRKRVKLLISSRQMARKYGHAPIAVSFRYDDGKVLHMTSHFYLQQTKLRGRRERAKGSAFAKAAGIRGAALKKLRRAGLDKVRAGALNSAYSMQRVTTNMLLDKSKTNKRLLRRFKKRAARAFSFEDDTVAPSLRAARVAEGYLLMVVKRKGKRVRVRDLFGREGWTEATNIK